MTEEIDGSEIVKFEDYHRFVIRTQAGYALRIPIDELEITEEVREKAKCFDKHLRNYVAQVVTHYMTVDEPDHPWPLEDRKDEFLASFFRLEHILDHWPEFEQPQRVDSREAKSIAFLSKQFSRAIVGWITHRSTQTVQKYAKK